MSVGTVGRFAGTFLGKALGSKVFQAAVPRGWDLAADLAPNLIFAGLSAASLPEGTDAATRAGAAAEDFLVSVPLGWLGRGAGFKAAQGISRMRKTPLDDRAVGMITNLAGMVPEQAAWWSGVMPRPFANKAYEQYQARMSEQQLQEQALRDEQVRQELLHRLGGAGYLAAPFMGV